MKILSEVHNGIGGKWVLVEYGNDFYAYGSEQDLYTLFGFPVSQRGTKEEVLKHCKLILDLCKNNIKIYQNKFTTEKKNTDGWKLLIENEMKELKMLIEFSKILSC